MTPILIEGPIHEPISLNEAKIWLKLDGEEEDDVIRALIVAARLMVEAEIGHVLIGQNWRLIGDSWPPSGEISLRLGKVLAVQAARVFGADGVAIPLAPESITVLQGEEGSILIPTSSPVPGRARAGIEIDLRLGFGEAASDVPEPIRLAIRRTVALWFENRGDGTEAEMGLPPQIRSLLRPFRRVRL